MLGARAVSLDRMVSAVEKVRQRLAKACGALDRAGIEYAVVGGNAVAAWVSTIDEAAVRNTRDVDVMVRRSDLDEIRSALEGEGFFYCHVAGLDVFLDREDSSVRDSVHLRFAEELVREGELAPNSEFDNVVDTGEFKLLDIQSLVQIKLTAYRDKDRTHLRDMIEVGLVDESWLGRLAPPLATRLKAILDTPEG